MTSITCTTSSATEPKGLTVLRPLMPFTASALAVTMGVQDLAPVYHWIVDQPHDHGALVFDPPATVEPVLSYSTVTVIESMDEPTQSSASTFVGGMPNDDPPPYLRRPDISAWWTPQQPLWIQQTRRPAIAPFSDFE